MVIAASTQAQFVVRTSAKGNGMCHWNVCKTTCCCVTGDTQRIVQATRALQRMSIDPAVLQRLANKRLFTAKDLLIATQLELVEALDIPFRAVEELVLHVSTHIAPQTSTVTAVKQSMTTAAPPATSDHPCL